MGMGRLVFPEEHSLDIVAVIRAGLEAIKNDAATDDEDVAPEVRQQLTRWCDETEEYWSDDGD